MAWFSTQGAQTMNVTVNVTQPLYNVAWGAHTTPATMNLGQTVSPKLTFTNAGSLNWNASGANPVRVAYHWLNGACPGSTTAVYDGRRTLLPGDVTSGATVSNLTVAVDTPNSAGTYCLVYDLVREGITWFGTQGSQTLALTVNVVQPVYGVSWGAHTTPSAMSANSTVTPSVTFTNLGSLTWNAGGSNPVRIAYHWINGACPGTTAAVWDGRRTALPGDVASGGTVSSLSVNVNTPSSAGTYCLVYDLVREGVTWFATQGSRTLAVTVNVTPGSYGVSWTGDDTPASMAASSTNNVSLDFTNTGTAAWNNVNPNPVNVAYHWKNGTCPGTTTAVWDGARTSLPSQVNGGDSVTALSAQVNAPAAPGSYCLIFDLVKEGVAWFSSLGLPTLKRDVIVTP
jgi:hypothetical protein